MAKVCTLYSGSSGNSAYVGIRGCNILIDAGVSCKALCAGLASHDVNPAALEGIFITHEHIDHIKGLKVFLKKYPTAVYSSEKTLVYLIDHDCVPPGTVLCPTDNRTVCLDKMQVECFSTSHDAADSMGFRITTEDERTVGYSTDLGEITPEVEKGLENCDFVILEANYDGEMLRSSSYPYYLKQRISSAKGHLSNTVAANFAAKLPAQGTTRLMLAHLSRENNTPSLAYDTIYNALKISGYAHGRDYILSVAPRSEPSEMIYL